MRVYGPIRPLWKKINKQRKNCSFRGRGKQSKYVYFFPDWDRSNTFLGIKFESVLMRWMKLEPIIQSEVSQKDKDHYSILTHIYGI